MAPGEEKPDSHNYVVAKGTRSYWCQAKFLTSAKYLTYYYLSVILLLRVKE